MSRSHFKKKNVQSNDVVLIIPLLKISKQANPRGLLASQPKLLDEPWTITGDILKEHVDSA